MFSSTSLPSRKRGNHVQTVSLLEPNDIDDDNDNQMLRNMNQTIVNDIDPTNIIAGSYNLNMSMMGAASEAYNNHDNIEIAPDAFDTHIIVNNVNNNISNNDSILC